MVRGISALGREITVIKRGEMHPTNTIDPTHCFYYRAMLAQSAVMRQKVVCLSVCLSVRNDQVPCTNMLEFFENNFTAE